ncbi:MAG: MFS transporter, partial [Verrucomicrobiota bacterium]
DTYEIFTFGFKVMEFPLHTWLAEIIFNGLNWSAILVIAGVMIMMRRRLTHAGQIAIQTFEGDWLPLLLLLAISLTGLGISLDYKFMEGKAHQFMAITHAITVILFLLWMPFGKFYHIIQRPAQLGVSIYRKAGAEGPQAVCPHTKQPFTSQMHVNDLKDVTAQLGFDFKRKDGSTHLDYSPQGKRALLAKAHLQARQKSGSLFG